MSVILRRNALRSVLSIVPRRNINDDTEVKPFEAIPGPCNGDSIRPQFGESNFDRLHHTYAKMYEKYGPLVREVSNPELTFVHVFDANEMLNVYLNEGKLPVRPSHTALVRYRESRPDLYSCGGLLSNGENWLRFRRLFNNIVYNSSLIYKNCRGAMEDVTESLMARIAAELDSNNEISIEPMMYKWSLESVAAVALDSQFGCLSAKGDKDGAKVIEAAMDIHKYVYLTENLPDPNGSIYEKTTEAHGRIENLVQQYTERTVKEIEQGQHEKSLLAKMLGDKDITRKDAFTMLVDMFTGGTDTTAISLTFILYNLAIHPAVQDALRQDLMQLPSKTARVSDSGVNVRSVQKVVAESLRVNPPGIGIGRVIPKDMVISGYRVPAKSLVLLHHQVASMQEHNFKDARTFNPYRWGRRGEPEVAFPLATCPYGYGVRKCIGFRIAQEELIIAVARIIRNFKVSYHHEPVDTINRLVNVPDKPVLLRFEAVEN